MKFSIITPTYNRAHTIERAIKSLQNQSYSNWEMIIVDDGSIDNTEERIKQYLNKDKRIKYIKLKQNGGVGKARNVGIKNISPDSDWIGFLDSDDELLPNAFELMKKKIEEFPVIKHFSFSTIYENGKKASFLKKDNLEGNYEIVLGKNNLAEGEFFNLLHKSIINDGFKFEENVNGYEYIAWLRLAKKNFKHLYTTTIVRVYITRGESLIRNKNKNKKYYENAKKGLQIGCRV
jgi:teichuronic acid biosynthesis glycosyltransferase TuaG